MTVTNVTTDASARTLTITAEFSAPITSVWQLWDDPRRLERWWGPPSHPATMVEHDLRPGGRVTYFMTGPEGDEYHGWWRVIGVDAPEHLEFEDGFADASGTPNPEMPTNLTHVAIEQSADGTTRMTVVSTFPSEEAMTRLLEMGMVEGMSQAMGQMDAVVAEVANT
jgi:uncharacterized protein YndB with AHSA1/START domain